VHIPSEFAVIIRRVYGKPAKPSPPQQTRQRQLVQTPTACKTCNRVRAFVAAILPAKKGS